MLQTMVRIKVADEVWIAAALLHREHPKTDDLGFTSMSFSIALRTAPQIRVATGCYMKQRKGGGGSIGKAIRITPEEKMGRLVRNRPRYHLLIATSYSGTTNGQN